MKRTTLLIIATVALAGCASDGSFRSGTFFSEVCDPPRVVQGFTLTAIHYGDSRLIVIPISKIKVNSEFRFILVPKRRSDTDEVVFSEQTVSISSDDDDDAGETEPGWLEVEGTASDDGTLALCVPESVARNRYKYDVVVTEVGQLDPRADVID